jgi:methyl-accepting chemotaxis protein
VLKAATADLAVFTLQQKEGVSDHARAVTHMTSHIEEVAQSATTLLRASRGIVGDAEATCSRHFELGQKMSALQLHSARLGELLDLVRSVANKADVLALNAALEGYRAGDRGGGVALVAGEMQHLAETTAAAVRGVRHLMRDIESSTREAALSLERAAAMADDTSRRARTIDELSANHLADIKRAVRSAHRITRVSSEVASGTAEAESAADELNRLSKRLGDSVQRFVV